MALVACKSEGTDCRVKNNSRASELQAAGMHGFSCRRFMHEKPAAQFRLTGVGAGGELP